MTGKRKHVVFIEWCPNRKSKARKTRTKRTTVNTDATITQRKPALTKANAKVPLAKAQATTVSASPHTNPTQFITPWALHAIPTGSVQGSLQGGVPNTLQTPITGNSVASDTTDQLPWPTIASITGTQPSVEHEVNLVPKTNMKTNINSTHVRPQYTNIYPAPINHFSTNNGGKPTVTNGTVGGTLGDTSAIQPLDIFHTKGTTCATVAPSTPQNVHWEDNSVPMLPVTSSAVSMSFNALSASMDTDARSAENFVFDKKTTDNSMPPLVANMNEFALEVSQPSEGLDTENLGIYPPLSLEATDLNSPSWPDISLAESPKCRVVSQEDQTETVDVNANPNSAVFQKQSVRAPIATLELAPLAPLDHLHGNTKLNTLQNFEPSDTESLSGLAMCDLDIASYASMADLTSIPLDTGLCTSEARSTPASTSIADLNNTGELNSSQRTNSLLWESLSLGSSELTLSDLADISSNPLQLSDDPNNKGVVSHRDSGIVLDGEFGMQAGMNLHDALMGRTQGISTYTESNFAFDNHFPSLSPESHTEHRAVLSDAPIRLESITQNNLVYSQHPTQSSLFLAVGSPTGRVRSTASVSTCASDIETHTDHTDTQTTPGAPGYDDLLTSNTYDYVDEVLESGTLSRVNSVSVVSTTTDKSGLLSEGLSCENCGISGEKIWRCNATLSNWCNACNLYWKAKGKLRPQSLAASKLTRLVRKRLSKDGKPQKPRKKSTSKKNVPSKPATIAVPLTATE